jgi:hypothetical protein
MNVSAVNAQKRLTGPEAFFYVMWNILTLGWPYLTKILIKKAVMEALEAERLAMPGSPPLLLPAPVPGWTPPQPGAGVPLRDSRRQA